jgi:hypothetical protein
VLKGGADVVENASFGSIDNEADTRLHASDRFERAILELTFKKKKKSMMAYLRLNTLLSSSGMEVQVQ